MLFNYDKNGFSLGGTNLSSYFTNENKEILSEGNNQAFLDQFKNKNLWEKTDNDYITRQADSIGDVNQSLVTYIQKSKEAGVSADNLESGFIAQTSAATKFKGVLTNLGDVGGKALATLGNALVSMGISMAVSYVVQAIQNVINSYDLLAAKVGEITQKYQTASGTVDDYMSKLVNIRTKLEDESTTTEEATQMTAELYSIQSDLISTYGSYAAGIDLVNGKLEDQIGILQEINKQNLQQWENEVNSERSNASKAINYGTNVFWGAVNPISNIKKGFTSFGDWLGGKSVKEVSSDFAFGEDWLGVDNGTAILGNNLQQISKQYEDFQDVINATDNSKINEIIDSFEEFEVIDGKIKVKGSVDEVSDAVLRLQTELSDLGYENESLNQDLVQVAKNAKDVIDSTGDTYDTNIFNQIMHTDELSQKYIELTEAYNNYKSAQDNGDIEAAEEALNTYLTKLGDIENSNIEQKYKTYFENMYDDLQGEVDSWKVEFEIAPKIKDTDLESYIFENDYEEIFSDFQKWGQGIDLPDNIENYFETLRDYANETGLTIEQLIQILQKLDGFDYTKATGMLKKASSGGNGLSTELQEATKKYYDAVAQYEKVGADKSTFKSGNVELGQNYDFTSASYSGEGYEIVYTPYVYNPETGEKESLTTKEINDYISNIIDEATNQETGEIDFDMVMELDQKGVYNDSTGHVMQNLFMQAGNLGGASISNYQAEAKAINDRIVAFRDLYNAANDANMSVEEVKASFNNGLNWNDEQIASFLNSLSEDELNAFLTLDLDDVSKVKTEEELRQMIDEAQKIADDNAIEIKTKYSESIDALDAMEDAFGGLDTVYETTVTNKEIASASDIEQVNSDMGGTTFNEQDPSSVNGLSNAIEAYNQALVENAGDSDAAQDAANKLATAYVDQTNVLDSLTSNLDDITDEQKNYIIEQLEANGITNAADVVESRLNKRYKATATSLKSLSKYITQNRKAYDEAIESEDENSETLVGMTENLQDLLSLYNEEGDAVITPELDSSFIIDNADKIEKAISGDVDALAELRVEAAKKIYADVEVFDDNFWADCMSIADEISTLDSSDFTIDGYMNNSDIIAKLNAIKAKCAETGQEFASVLSYITGGAVTAEYEFEHVSLAGQNGAASEAKATILKSVKYKWNGSSSGSSVNYGGGGSSSSSSGGGGSDSGSDSEDSSETFDWVEVQIDRIEEQLDRLDEAVDNVYSNWESRNNNLRKEIELTNTEISKQVKAAQIYEEKANAVNWGSTDSATKNKYIEKIKNGEIIDVNSIEEITNNDDLTEAISEYQDYWQKHIDALDTATTLGITVKEYYKQLFENIESEYDDLITNIEKKNDIIEERITRTEEHGYFVDQKYYKDELKLEEENNKKLIEERAKLIESLNEAVNKGKIESGSEAWNDMYQSIMDVNKAIEESYTNTVKLNNALRQLKWDAFDWVEERISDVSAEADFLIKILQGELNYEDNGEFTNRGFAQAALVGAKYDDTLKKAQRYRDEILKINEDLAKDPNDKNLVERKEELVQAYRDAIEAAEDEKQAMKSLVEEAINKNLEALQKLIDKYKESLSSAKDLYEYSKNIADQTKNITNLQKQLTALSGDDSEEARKRRQELTNQLDAAEQQLEETEWDRYISETGEMLDDLYSDYEEYLTGKLDYITVLMNDMIKYLNLNGSNVQAGIQEVKDMYGMSTLYFEDFGKTSQDMLSSFNNGDFANKLTTINSTIDNFRDAMVKVTDTASNGVIAAIEKNSVDIVVNSDGTVGITSKGKTATVGGGGSGSGKSGSKTTNNGGSKTSSGKTGTWKGNSTDGWWYQYSDGSYPKNQWEKIDGKSYYFDPNGYMLADQYVEGYFLGKDGAWDGGSKSSWKSNSSGWWYESADGNYITGNWALIDGEWYYFDGSGYMVTGKRTIGGKSYTFGSDGKWKGYAKGIRRVPNNQMAWTQEDKSELIFRSSDGAMLTPLNRGDMVFTAEMSQRLWDFASGNVPRFDNGVPNMRSLSTRNINANNNLTVVLPNVESYDDFKRQLKADKNVEDWMQEITIGRVMGNNTLRKNRY